VRFRVVLLTLLHSHSINANARSLLVVVVVVVVAVVVGRDGRAGQQSRRVRPERVSIESNQPSPNLSPVKGARIPHLTQKAMPKNHLSGKGISKTKEETVFDKPSFPMCVC